tara:strand:+ start:679 stop:897 length:219 start_codon:yes stop_codon:yes gene_type:complete
MAANTEENRQQVADIIVGELESKHSDAYGSFIIEYVKNQLIHQWSQCDDSWHDATDRVVGMLYGQPWGVDHD